MEQEVTQQKIFAALDESGDVIGYYIGEYDGTSVEIDRETHAEHMENPGVYTWNGTEFDYQEYTAAEPTENEQTENALMAEFAAKFAAIEALAEIQAQAVAKTATPKIIKRLAALYPTFGSLVGKEINKDVTPYIRHNGEIYLVVQSHTAAAHWTPGTAGTESLFSKVAEPGTVAAWVQPLGGHDAYNKPGSGLPKSDPVTHGGKIWESLVNGNGHEPGAPGTESVWKLIQTAAQAVKTKTGATTWKNA